MCMPQVQQVNAARQVSPALQSLLHRTFWALFLILGPIGYYFIPPLEDPSLGLTIGAWCQLLAVSIYWLIPRVGMRGDSPDFCLLFICALCLRLTMTCKYQGYLPGDETGDGPYQLLEILTLLVAFRGLARTGLKTKHVAAVSVLLAVTAVLACQCYGDMNRRVVADRIYAASIYAEALAWFLLARTIIMSGKTRDMHGSFMLPMVASGALRAHFWWMAYPEMTAANPIRYMAVFPEALIVVHTVMTVLAAVAGLYILNAAYAAKSEANNVPAQQVAMSTPFVQAGQMGAPVSSAFVPSIAGLSSLPAPAGSGAKCFAPSSATFENGILQIQYVPVY